MPASHRSWYDTREVGFARRFARPAPGGITIVRAGLDGSNRLVTPRDIALLHANAAPSGGGQARPPPCADHPPACPPPRHALASRNTSCAPRGAHTRAAVAAGPLQAHRLLHCQPCGADRAVLLILALIPTGGPDILVRAGRQECRPHRVAWLRSLRVLPQMSG